ncbi:hypothetical protein F4819DRAFT_460951 [Hypoxylon fuscum]|nr:hypothetical protein F4819DRAFT_460951 [Hypoxylon fuscum]
MPNITTCSITPNRDVCGTQGVSEASFLVFSTIGVVISTAMLAMQLWSILKRKATPSELRPDTVGLQPRVDRA